MPGIPTPRASTKSPSARRRLRIYRGWWIVLAGFLCQLSLSSSTGWVFSFLILPMETDLGWSRAELVGVLTVAFLLNGVLSVLLGPVVDRYGPRWLMTIGAFVGGASLLLVSHVSAPWQYYLMLGVGLSVAEASLQNLGPVTAIANWFVRKRTHAFTVSTLGSPLAGIFMVPTVAWLVSLGGWRAGWIALGLTTWCIMPIAWFFIRRRPEDVGLLPDGDTSGSSSMPEPSDRPEPDRLPEEPLWTVREALRSRSFWMLVAALSLFGMASSGLFIHITPYIVEKGFSPSFAAFVMSLFGFTVLACRFGWGFAIARLGIRAPILGCGVAFGLGIFLFTLPASALGILATTTFIGFAASALPLFQSQVFPDYFGRRIVGSLMGYAGIFMTVARAVSPLFAAILHDSTQSYLFAFSIFGLACFVGSAAVLMAPSPRLRSKQITAG